METGVKTIPRHRKKWEGYALAAASSLLALLVRHLVVHEELHRTLPYLFFYFSLTASAWFGGFGPGLLATLLGFAAASGYLVKVQNLEYDLAARLQAAVFVVSGVFISSLFESLHAAKRRLLHKMQILESEAALRRETQATLLDADRNRNDFLATLAHELRGPLGAISNALELLEALPDVKTATAARAIMKRQAGQMAAIISDLMDAARVSGNKIELKRGPVLVSAALQTAIDGARPLLDRSGHALAVSVGRRPVWVDGDQARLAQIFLNLLANAAKYTEPQGRISVFVTEQAGRVKIIFRDTGIGIHADVLPRIFDLYVQADAALNRSQGGLGIGLSLVRRLVTLHGGTVEARSAGPGKGSEFEVNLPALSSGPQLVADVMPVSASADGRETVPRTAVIH